MNRYVKLILKDNNAMYNATCFLFECDAFSPEAAKTNILLPRKLTIKPDNNAVIVAIINANPKVFETITNTALSTNTAVTPTAIYFNGCM